MYSTKSVFNAIRYIFIQEYKPTIIDSQVINWIELLDGMFSENHIVSILPTRNVKLADEKTRDVENRIHGGYHELVLSKMILIRDFQLLLYILKLYVKHVRRAQVIMQSRFILFYLVAPALFWLPKLRFVHEARGTAITEYLYNEQRASVKSRKAWFIKYREKMILTYSNLIICVSEKQREFILTEYKSINSKRILVVPGVADLNDFYYSPSLMNRARKELMLDGSTVFLYSGRLDKDWQLPEMVFKTIQSLYSQILNSYFVILTPDQSIAKQYIHRFKLPERIFLVKYVPISELNRYLNAADYGFLFREDLPINNQASPTKFCEYILAGMKVLISKGIGDFSQFVVDHQCGYVGSNVEGTFTFDCRQLTILDPAERERISEIGKEYLSKQAYIEKIRSAFSEILI